MISQRWLKGRHGVDTRRMRRWFTVTPSFCGHQEEGPLLGEVGQIISPPPSDRRFFIELPPWDKNKSTAPLGSSFCITCAILDSAGQRQRTLLTVRNLAAYNGISTVKHLPRQKRSDKGVRVFPDRTALEKFAKDS